MSPLDELEALRKQARIGSLAHVAGILKHYVASSPCDEYGNAPDEADFAGFSIQEMHPRDGRDVPAEAQARFIVAAVNIVPSFTKLARTAITTLAAAGPLTFTPPGQDRPSCLFCGAPVNSGDCCLDEMRAVLRELTQERSPV